MSDSEESVRKENKDRRLELDLLSHDVPDFAVAMLLRSLSVSGLVTGTSCEQLWMGMPFEETQIAGAISG